MGDKNVILIAVYENNLYFKALGHITANLCFPLRDLIVKRLTQFSCPFGIFFDLSETDYMDSTFLGLLIGIEKNLYSVSQSHLQILNPNEISIKLMKNMGLDRFLTIVREDKLPELEYEIFNDEIDLSELERCKIILSTHKDLSSLSEENREKFKHLEAALEEEINNKA